MSSFMLFPGQGQPPWMTYGTSATPGLKISRNYTTTTNPKPSYMIVGKPTLRQLLRYWWHNRK